MADEDPNEPRRIDDGTPNRPMKLWEVNSAFSFDKGAIRAVFESPRWRDPYLGYLLNMVNMFSPRSEILDQYVPLELTREICERVSLVILLRHSPDGVWLHVWNPNNPSHADLQQLTALEVHDRFGPAIIEVVTEKGSERVSDGKSE